MVFQDKTPATLPPSLLASETNSQSAVLCSPSAVSGHGNPILPQVWLVSVSAYTSKPVESASLLGDHRVLAAFVGSSSLRVWS